MQSSSFRFDVESLAGHESALTGRCRNSEGSNDQIIWAITDRGYLQWVRVGPNFTETAAPGFTEVLAEMIVLHLDEIYARVPAARRVMDQFLERSI